MMGNFIWRRSDYGPKALGIMIQVLRDELFCLERLCYSDQPNVEQIYECLSKAKIQIDLTEKFMGSCIAPNEIKKQYD